MEKLLIIASGGAAGTLCRYWLSGAVQRVAGTTLPFGTMAVNLLGCLLFGTIWGALENRIGMGGEFRLLALTGFMGAFTTFSTYMFETASLVKVGQFAMAALNVAGQSVFGLVFVFAGLALGRLL